MFVSIYTCISLDLLNHVKVNILYNNSVVDDATRLAPRHIEEFGLVIKAMVILIRNCLQIAGHWLRRIKAP